MINFHSSNLLERSFSFISLVKKNATLKMTPLLIIRKLGDLVNITGYVAKDVVMLFLTKR